MYLASVWLAGEKVFGGGGGAGGGGGGGGGGGISVSGQPKQQSTLPLQRESPSHPPKLVSTAARLFAEWPVHSCLL